VAELVSQRIELDGDYDAVQQLYLDRAGPTAFRWCRLHRTGWRRC